MVFTVSHHEVTKLTMLVSRMYFFVVFESS